jgi:RHH-type transcriptional regulator, rel operon repressor / antitoxin RelB
MPTSVRLEPEIERRLDLLAEKTGRTKAYYLRELIAKGLEDIEDFYLADVAMERLRRGEERTYTSAEVRRDLGLED